MPEVFDALEMYAQDRMDILDIRDLPLEDWETTRQRYLSEYHWLSAVGTRFIGFNTSRPPFDDRRVRRAFAMALDRQALFSLFPIKLGKPADGGYVPPGMPGHTPGIALPFDPQKARQLLAQSGYPDGCGFPKVTLTISQAPVSQTIGQFQIDQWEQNLNVKIIYQVIPYPHVDSDLFLIEWVADYPDPANFLQGTGPLFRTGWHDSQYEALIEQAHHCLDQAQRMTLYTQAQKIMASEAVIVPLFYLHLYYLIKPWIQGFPISPVPVISWKDIIIEPHD